MLRSLYIRDYALIEELEVEFDSGLNIITGETGAGKSILLGAMKLLLGDRASTEAVRGGAKKAVIEGVFDNADEGRLPAVLAEHEIEPSEGGLLVVRREVSGRGSRAFINDTPATLDVLREVSASTIDLHGQHEHQSLLRTETHVELLDNFGGLGGLVETYRKAYRAAAKLVTERRDLVRREAELRKQKELYGFQIEEIDAAGLKEGEADDLEAERRILENAERLYEATAELYGQISDADDALYDRAVLVRNQLQDLARIDSAFDDTLADVRSAEIALKEATQFLQDYNARIEFNPERLDEIRERLGELDYLERKYGGTVEAVLAYRAEIGQTYDLAKDFEGAIARLDGRIADAQETLSKAAYRLSQKRHETAERIEEAIGVELATLGMPHARFAVQFGFQDDDSGWVSLPAGAKTHRVVAFPAGADLVEFYLSANLGEDPKPLAKVASGGEVSRIMLALKAVLAKSERLPILVFDEIDTGISGPIARRAGESMHRLGQFHQIIAITHLPQIASLGDVHFEVEKTVVDGRTRTHIRRLDEAERAEAVAQLLAGASVSPAALQSARELIEEGRAAE
ncbi:DNA repair protein RecN [Rubrivirga litoralis]|uniref:DNA repair protein RecN n=1 Tax=Rubrivirga litoralis TaxID=3075598 RepID=A0ABU3BM59_9BACT|nr:DNA repair protein RecN [Rubrivirga sp. F394]MDT0630377.1 DNA repair protein RecN [Rubrivirga sp. F394]